MTSYVHLHRGAYAIPHCDPAYAIPHCDPAYAIPHCDPAYAIPHCDPAYAIPHCNAALQCRAAMPRCNPALRFRRLATGKSSVGFANPALYGWQGDNSIFNDIEQGANNCCAGGWSGSTVTCCPTNGFYATKGWDPVTGLGSVNFGNLIAAWAAL